MHLGVNQELLYVANDNTIKIVDIRCDMVEGVDKEILPEGG